MPISVPVTKRIPKGAPITALEHDTNLDNIVTGIQTVDGRIDGVETTITALDADKLDVTEFDSSFEGENAGKKQVHWDNVTNKPADKTLQATVLTDPIQRTVSGINTRTVISSWTVTNVPAGTIFVFFQMSAERDNGADDVAGDVFVTVNGTDVITTGTHSVGGVDVGADVSITGFGTFTLGTTGSVTVEVLVSSALAGYDIEFGVSGNDPRFGRRVGLISGM